ncbi:unnamed protein product (mitochondrion) [Plasmodiophora brassicae]|uniref:F-box domain-containing protein n=1 Tax=Plasmodiophora brassicae TaxID=37360 RepID=A0A0G4J1I4_PLABS|nr:hypothetical protein PBRA_008443 [Plasmodiophora brassicae]SPR01587.1 unnamed protein product [Plasmodiophora brassicae]
MLTTELLALPDDLLGAISLGLFLVDKASLALTSRRVRQALQRRRAIWAFVDLRGTAKTSRITTIVFAAVSALQVLDLSFSAAVNGVVLMALRHCPRLRTLSIKGCRTISGQEVVAAVDILTRCTDLCQVHMAGTTKVIADAHAVGELLQIASYAKLDLDIGLCSCRRPGERCFRCRRTFCDFCVDIGICEQCITPLCDLCCPTVKCDSCDVALCQLCNPDGAVCEFCGLGSCNNHPDCSAVVADCRYVRCLGACC